MHVFFENVPCLFWYHFGLEMGPAVSDFSGYKILWNGTKLSTKLQLKHCRRYRPTKWNSSRTERPTDYENIKLYSFCLRE